MKKKMINRILQNFGLRITKIPHIPRELLVKYKKQLNKLREAGGLNIKLDLRYSLGSHPKDRADYQCEFVTKQLNKLPPNLNILDIGTYREYILGLLAHYKITTIDIRKRESDLKNEKIITCDAKKLDLPDNTFDALISLCSIEHFGLGRYGDEIDLDADKKAFKEMTRVLRVGGYLIFSVDYTDKKTIINFNSGRMYDINAIYDRFYGEDLMRIEEKLLPELNLYLGFWRKC